MQKSQDFLGWGPENTFMLQRSKAAIVMRVNSSHFHVYSKHHACRVQCCFHSALEVMSGQKDGKAIFRVQYADAFLEWIRVLEFGQSMDDSQKMAAV